MFGTSPYPQMNAGGMTGQLAMPVPMVGGGGPPLPIPPAQGMPPPYPQGPPLGQPQVPLLPPPQAPGPPPQPPPQPPLQPGLPPLINQSAPLPGSYLPPKPVPKPPSKPPTAPPLTFPPWIIPVVLVALLALISELGSMSQYSSRPPPPRYTGVSYTSFLSRLGAIIIPLACVAVVFVYTYLL